MVRGQCPATNSNLDFNCLYSDLIKPVLFCSLFVWLVLIRHIHSPFARNRQLRFYSYRAKELARAFGVLMSRAKRISILITEINEWLAFAMKNIIYLKLIHFSTTDKVSHGQHTEDLEVLERKLTKRIDDKVFTVNRLELHLINVSFKLRSFSRFLRNFRDCLFVQNWNFCCY